MVVAYNPPSLPPSCRSTYHGTYVKLLDELVKDKAFLRLQGRDKPDDDKEEDRELLLRLFSWVGGVCKGGPACCLLCVRRAHCVDDGLCSPIRPRG